jgi:hypothetical protein
MSNIITVVWIAPSGNRWGVKHNGDWLVEPTLPLWKAAEEAERIAREVRQTVKIVNVKTEPMKKKRHWG